MPRIRPLAVALSLLSAGCASGEVARSEPTADVFTPILGSILGGPPSPVHGTDGRHHVLYELLLTNAKSVTATLHAVEVMDAASGSRLGRFEGAELLGMLRVLSARPAADLDLPPNESRVVLVSLDFSSGAAVPHRLEHRIEARGAASPAARVASPISYRVAPVALAGPAQVFRPPLEGEGWLVINGCCGDAGAHRGAIQSINGGLFDSQRFAIDFVRVEAEGRLAMGEPADVRSWAGYGARVLAAASGQVVAARSDLADQRPGALPDPSTISVDTVDGNFAVIDHGRGLFTFYAHLQPGSVRVRAGDRVAAGQELGRLGNTGNTSAPHLHFQVMDGPSPLGSDGRPFVFARFELAGVVADSALDAALSGAASLPARKSLSPERREGQLPLDRSLVDFEPVPGR